MANETTTTNIPPQRNARGCYFAFVAQLDITEQMEVVRWLRADPRYRVVTIVHDRDTYAEGDTLPDGMAVGDRKNSHVHGIVKVGKKITAASLSKRFGAYLHFELLHDPAEYAHYILHKTFNSREKAQYEFSELLDDVQLWCDVSDSEREDDICAVVAEVASYKDASGSISVEQMLRDRNAMALKSLMGHSYFYATFVNSNKKEVE